MNDLVDTGSGNEIKIAAMLELQRQKAVTRPQQRHFNPLILVKLITKPEYWIANWKTSATFKMDLHPTTIKGLTTKYCHKENIPDTEGAS